MTVGIFVERQHAGYFGKASWRRRHPPAVVHHGWQGMFEWRVVYFDFGLHSCQAGRAAGPRRPGGVGVWAATSSHAGLLQARLHPPAGRRRRGARAHSDGLWSSALCHVPRGLPAVHPTPPQLCNDTFRDPPTCERALSDAYFVTSLLTVVPCCFEYTLLQKKPLKRESGRENSKSDKRSEKRNGPSENKFGKEASEKVPSEKVQFPKHPQNFGKGVGKQFGKGPP